MSKINRGSSVRFCQVVPFTVLFCDISEEKRVDLLKYADAGASGMWSNVTRTMWNCFCSTVGECMKVGLDIASTIFSDIFAVFFGFSGSFSVLYVGCGLDLCFHYIPTIMWRFLWTRIECTVFYFGTSKIIAVFWWCCFYSSRTRKFPWVHLFFTITFPLATATQSILGLEGYKH